MRSVQLANGQTFDLYYHDDTFYLSRDGGAYTGVLVVDNVTSYDLRPLPTGGLVMIYRTDGAPVRVYSHDGGRTWA